MVIKNYIVILKTFGTDTGGGQKVLGKKRRYIGFGNASLKWIDREN